MPVWPVAEAAAKAAPLDDAERAMIAQAVAPHLAGMTPGSIHRRHAMGQSPVRSLSGVKSQDRRVRAETRKGGSHE